MVWLHPALLIGLSLAAIPVVLHLLMRAKPKKLIFPALRLIQNRRRTNVRRLRLRHLALLLLRMAVIALIVFAVARPSVPAADYSLRGGDWLRLLVLGAAVAGVYFGVQALWHRRKLPPHELAYRRTLLRSGLAVAGIVVFGLLVAWPYQKRIAAAITQPTLAPSEFLPVAAVMLFDTSLSMQYRQESRTRLEAAQEIATKHLGNLPRLSRVAVSETSGDAPLRFQSDLSAAAKRIATLAAEPVSRPLDDRLLAAIEAQLDDQERSRGSGEADAATDLLREIYVFTDLTSAAWRKDEVPRLKEALTKAAGVSVYLIDVGVSSPTNFAITALSLTEQTIPRGGTVTLRAMLEAVGAAAEERVVELYVENQAGVMSKLGQQPVKLDPAAAATTLFSLPGAGGPVLQGEVRLLASDPLAFDDVRYFSLLVQPAAELLVVADRHADALFLMQALAPSELAALGKTRFRCRYLAAAKIGSTDLSKYAAVCLMNVADPKPAGWKALADYVADGGNSLVVLGDRTQQTSYLSPAARDVMPAEPARTWEFNPPEFLDLSNLSHPIFKKLDELGGIAGLTSMPIAKYWRVTPDARDTAVIATFTDERRGPALVERAHGKGRVLLMTTSLDRRWSELPMVGWEFTALADQMLMYLTRSSGEVYNYQIGEPVRVTLDPALAVLAYLLRKPLLQQLRSDVPPGAAQFIVNDVDQIGNYRLTGADAAIKFARGFSVNADGSESNLQRMTKDDLDMRLGTERYSLARDINNLQRNVRAGRLGREAFPLLAVILLAVFVGEHWIANRFYDPEPQSATT